jgi:hypothetical protein
MQVCANMYTTALLLFSVSETIKIKNLQEFKRFLRSDQFWLLVPTLISSQASKLNF